MWVGSRGWKWLNGIKSGGQRGLDWCTGYVSWSKPGVLGGDLVGGKAGCGTRRAWQSLGVSWTRPGYWMWSQTRTDGLGGNRERRIGHWARSWRRKCRIGLGREVARGMDHFYLKRGLALYTPPSYPGTHFSPLHQLLKWATTPS